MATQDGSETAFPSTINPENYNKYDMKIYIALIFMVFTGIII